MAVAAVGTPTTASSGTSYVQSFTITRTVTAGSLLVVAFGDTGNATGKVSGVTDNLGNTWTKAADIITAEGKHFNAWYAMNAAAGSTTVTATSPDFIAWTATLREFSGAATSAALDVTATALDADYVQSHSAGPTTATTVADAVAVFAYAGGSIDTTYTVGTGYADLAIARGGTDTFISSASQHKILTATGTQSGSITTSAFDKGAMGVLVFKGAAPAVTPTAPTGLTATAGDTTVALSWTAPPEGATSYTVKRATVTGGPYTNIATPTSTSYTDTGLTNGTAYYYVVSATNGAGTSGNSTEATATPAAVVVNPSDWHPYGVQPNATVAAMRKTFRDKVDSWFSYVLTDVYYTGGNPPGVGWTGTTALPANTRLPGTVRRIMAPDQGFYTAKYANFSDTRRGTVSEGQAYGALFMAWLSNSALPADVYKTDAKAIFDSLFRFYDYHADDNGLMNWHILADGQVGDTGGATDGDEDMGEALRVMSVLHGDAGTINYGAEAERLILAMMNTEFVPETHANTSWRNLMLNGDKWGVDADNYMPDYSRMGYWRAWAKWLRDVRGNTAAADRWERILTRNYDHIDDYYLSRGYKGVPDRQTRSYGTISAGQDNITYNSVRLGFGWMLDYCWHGSTEPRAKTFMDIIADQAKANFGTGGNVKAPDYNPGFTTWQAYGNLTGYGYIGSCSLGKTENKTFATEIYNSLAGSTEYTSSYFNGGIGVYGLAIMSGLAQPYDGTVAPAPSDTGQVKFHNGTSWVKKPAKVWNGTAWVAKPVKRYNGTSWVVTS